jgi:hypothetical protein
VPVANEVAHALGRRSMFPVMSNRLRVCDRQIENKTKLIAIKAISVDRPHIMFCWTIGPDMDWQR